MSKSIAEDRPKSRLGRGLAALIGDADDEDRRPTPSGGTRRVPVEFLRPNPRNPRHRFDDGPIDELAASIRERGIIQPIIARPMPGLRDVFEIVAGERRWRAAQRAELHEVPVLVIEADDKTALELAIIENVQRADLNAVEEAAGYSQLVAEHGYTQADLAATLGKSRSHVANTIRLLKLPASVRDRLARGELSAGHARALLAVADPETVAARIVADGLNVREVERLAQDEADEATHVAPERKSRAEPAADSDTRALAKELQDVLGLAVRISHRDGAGEIRIRYGALEQLDEICGRLRAKAA